ncbi:MAG TPA: hypothetical protein VH165_26060 [Kofleriaceae bacterium]|nr:hypothetical protein [Kofleriaceae bacterium]
MQSGALQPVSTNIPRAVTTALSADAFAKLSAAAGPLIQTLNVPALLASKQPMVTEGDSLANLKLSLSGLNFANPKISLTPTNGGLMFTAQLDTLKVTANVAYGGTLVPSGSSVVNITADHVTIGGTLVVTPNGTAGFTTALNSPTVNTVNLVLQSSGITGSILDLLNSTLGSSLQSILTEAAAAEMSPLLNDALGALEGPQQLDVLGQKLDVQASPSAVTFSSAGALVTIDLKVMLEGSQSSPGYIYTANGNPTMDAGHGIQLGLADDLVNELLAQVHALGLLNVTLQKDLGIIDTAQFQLTMPPMVSANNPDGTMRLVLSDMIASFSDKGKPVAKAAINAQIDLKLAPSDAQDVALQFGKVDLRVNLLDDTTPSDGLSGDDLASAATDGISIQLDSLSKLLITLPVPSLEGIQLQNVSVGADSGYIVMSGQIQ